MTWEPEQTYVCDRCYRERPLSESPLRLEGEDTHNRYLYCPECVEKMGGAK